MAARDWPYVRDMNYAGIPMSLSTPVKPFKFILGSGLIDHNQKSTVAAMQIADMKVWAHLS